MSKAMSRRDTRLGQIKSRQLTDTSSNSRSACIITPLRVEQYVTLLTHVQSRACVVYVLMEFSMLSR